MEFTGVYNIFLISAQNINGGYSLEPPRRGGSNEYLQSMFWTEEWKIPEFFVWKISFLVVKFSVYLKRHVFIMNIPLRTFSRMAWLKHKLFFCFQILKLFTGYVAALAVGILFVVIFPFVGCCLCCCRMCGNCGGKRKQKVTTNMHCKRRIFASVLFAISIFTL